MSGNIKRANNKNGSEDVCEWVRATVRELGAGHI